MIKSDNYSVFCQFEAFFTNHCNCFSNLSFKLWI